MTVCIAATAWNYIVTASDMMITGTIISADDNTVKLESFSDDWMAMFSGSDISHASQIIEAAGEAFKKRDNTLRSAQGCFKKAYQEYLKATAEDQVLSRFGLTMEEFTATGKRRFDATTFAKLCDEIRTVSLGDLTFLVHGFDKDRQPHIFYVSEPGRVTNCDKPGFGVIGSGMYAAEGLLYYLNQNRTKTLEQTIYNTCSAKFMAERAGGVGRATYFFVSKHGSGGFSHKGDLIDRLRDEWDNRGSPRVPESALDIIKESGIICYSRLTEQPDPQPPKGDL